MIFYCTGTLKDFSHQFPRANYDHDNAVPLSVSRNIFKPISLSFFPSPEAPPPPEPAWEEKQTSVIHLAGEDFRESLKKKKHTLVMFYAPCE